MIQRLYEVGSSQRQQGPRGKSPEKQSQPQATESDRRREIQKRNAESRMFQIDEVRFHDPKHFHRMDTDDENCDFRYRGRVLLQRLRQQQREGKREVKQQKR